MFEPDKDYTLWYGEADTTNTTRTALANIAGGSGSMTFPAGVAALDLEVHPEYDGWLEKEGVWLEITSVTGGAIQPSSSTACVAIYDGPKYSAIELPIGPSEFAVCGLKNTGNVTTMPDIVGYRRDNACLLSYDGNEYTRSLWDNPPGSSSGYGLAVSDNGFVAGYVSAFPDTAVCWSNAQSWAVLGALPGGGRAQACGITTNGQHIAGHAVNSSSIPHAVRWDKSSGSWLAPVDLGALNNSTNIPNPAATSTSYAYAVNGTGSMVGASEGGTNNPSVLRAFRTAPGATIIASTDELRPFVDTNLYNISALGVDGFTNTATAINATGVAVGSSDAAVFWYSSGTNRYGAKEHRAHYWGTDGVPMNLGVLPGGNWSEATAINDGGMVVGSSRTSSDTNSVVGFICGGPGSPMISVQDPHLFYGSTNWSLTKPVDINNEGYILGNGSYGGAARSWLLVPLH